LKTANRGLGLCLINCVGLAKREIETSPLGSPFLQRVLLLEEIGPLRAPQHHSLKNRRSVCVRELPLVPPRTTPPFGLRSPQASVSLSAANPQFASTPSLKPRYRTNCSIRSPLFGKAYYSPPSDWSGGKRDKKKVHRKTRYPVKDVKTYKSCVCVCVSFHYSGKAPTKGGNPVERGELLCKNAPTHIRVPAIAPSQARYPQRIRVLIRFPLSPDW
jgi:hypothetical protein